MPDRRAAPDGRRRGARARRRRARRRREPALAARRSAGRRGGARNERLGSAGARFFRLTGSGDVWIAGAPARWLPVALTEDVLYVREDRVLAFDGTLSWETGTVPGADVRMLQFRGRGTVALALGEAPVAIKVTDDRPTLLSSGAAGRLGGAAGAARRAPAGATTPTAPFQVVCQGEGVVLHRYAASAAGRSAVAEQSAPRADQPPQPGHDGPGRDDPVRALSSSTTSIRCAASSPACCGWSPRRATSSTATWRAAAGR